MKGTGIFITKEELRQVQAARVVSGMFLSGGMPMGDPVYEVSRLAQKYNVPEGAGFNMQTGEFVWRGRDECKATRPLSGAGTG